MTTLSDTVYARKRAKDCVPNPLHPNDYLARWYAQGMVALLDNRGSATVLFREKLGPSQATTVDLCPADGRVRKVDSRGLASEPGRPGSVLTFKLHAKPDPVR